VSHVNIQSDSSSRKFVWSNACVILNRFPYFIIHICKAMQVIEMWNTSNYNVIVTV